MAGIKWNRPPTQTTRFFPNAKRSVVTTRPSAQSPRTYSGPRGVYKNPIPRPGTTHAKQATRPAEVVGTLSARTIFVWPRMGLRCGIGEYVRQLASVSDNALFCQKTDEVRNAEHVVVVLMPSLNEPIDRLTAFFRRVRRSGTRVTLDIHHLTVGQSPFQPLFREVDDVVWHLPSMPRLGGGGRYVPLPVPTLPQVEVARVGGLTHFGLGHPSKRVDVMARVAQALGTRLYLYGDRNGGLVPAELAQVVSVNDSYPDEGTLCRLLRQHDVGLIGRAPWSSEVQLNASASARFLIAAGVPTIVDQAPVHEDLAGVLDIVPFGDLEALVARTKLMIEDEDYRAGALERARGYAQRTSLKNVATQMRVTVR